MNDLSSSSATYSADLLGTIASNLAGLQGYDVMALELIQNADDAHATSIIFDVTDDALIVENDGTFSYCGQLDSRVCPSLAGPEQYSCDFHRITAVASGGKARRSENIGRFGIGFVSTYQICDHPEIQSAELAIKLLPELGRTDFKSVTSTEGTRFTLPWATNPDSPVRQALRVSHIETMDLDRVESDITQILDGALLFLRHLNHAELRRNGQLIRSCDLTRDDDDTLIIEFGPGKREEMWLVLASDAGDEAAALGEAFPQIKADERDSKIAVAFRLDSAPLDKGLFYAFLPTDQSSELPLHINADFYPEADRKSLILSGEKHQQRWNEMLLAHAARTIASQLFELRDQLGPELIWELIQRAWVLSESGTDDWQDYFWSALSTSINTDSELVWTRKHRWAPIGRTILPLADLSPEQEKLINQLGLDIADDAIVKRAQTVLQKLGTIFLSLKRLSSAIDSADILRSEDNPVPIEPRLLSGLYKPLWALIDRLANSLGPGRSPGDYFDHLPVLLTADNRPVSPANANRSEPGFEGVYQDLLPELNVINTAIHSLGAVRDLVQPLSLEIVVDCLESTIDSEADCRERLGTDGRKAHRLYRALADMNEADIEVSIVARLRKLPIFLTGKGFNTAEEVFLPGDFEDPIGFATILASSALDPIVDSFFQRSLNIKRLELRSYILDELPRCFASAIDYSTVNRLLAELAKHPNALDNDELRTALSDLPLVPTCDGNMAPPAETYFRNTELTNVLGDNLSYWVDDRRLDASHSILGLLRQLGLREQPSPDHLADRILQIATFEPTEQSQSACKRAFYAACELFENWKKHGEHTRFISRLMGSECLPAYEDFENWHCPEDLYAPYRLEAFSSQAAILPFRDTHRLNTELLQLLGVDDDPPTELVVAHLRHCIDARTKPSKAVYQVLNERSAKGSEKQAIATLVELACIYDESRGTFLRPNQLFWIAPNLGARALKVPSSLSEYRRLFDLLGIKDTPTPRDHLGIAQDIIDEFGDTGVSLPSRDRRIYHKCLETIADSVDGDEELELQVKTLRKRACILNLESKLCYPDEIAIRDSDWHESFFGDELSGMLTAFQPELQSLYRLIGIQYLSRRIRPVIGQKLGDRPRPDIAELFQQRAQCVVRVLHDRPRYTLADLKARLGTLKVVQCDTLDIMFVCDLRRPPLESPETPAMAHYEADENALYISTSDIGEFAIPAFNSLLHVLATSPTGASIPNLVLICELVLDATDLEAAERKLSAAGFPVEVDLDQSDEDDLDGEELGELGTGEDEEWSDTDVQSQDGSAVTDPETEEPSVGRGSGQQEKADERQRGRGRGSRKTPGADSTSDMEENKQHKKDRGKKRQHRLLSYVIPTGEDASEHDTDPSIREHNLTVEDRGRAAVVLYEKERGRDAIPQSQDNPGWDIVSTDTATGAIRYIEVKAIDGEWNNVGVGLSKLQFSEAQNYHNEYWLYVVENSGDKEHERVYPIQSPATKVTSFMFDQNWRDVARDVTSNGAAIVDEAPADGYIPGAHIDCGPFGVGVIKEVDQRGRTKRLLIEFGNGKEFPMNLNVTTMKLIDNPET